MGIGNPMPAEILPGLAFTGVLSLITDTGSPGTCEMQLWAERMSNSRKNARKGSRESKGLFEREVETEDDAAQEDRGSYVPLRAGQRAHGFNHHHMRTENRNHLNTEKEQ